VVDSAKLAALGATVASIAHELKNPLTYLEIVAQSMADSWDTPAFKESVIRVLPSEVERMKLIIDGLSDYSKVHELRIGPVEITSVVDRTLAILGYEIKKYEVAVVRDYPSGEEAKAFALADKDRIVQVFMNIIANALQAIAAAKKDGEEQSGQLTLSVKRTDHKISVAISDTGAGIAPEHLSKVFDPFFTTKMTGAGLGLSITKKIVDEHHGSLEIDSRPGQGTTFTVTLPAA
jgi:signal transduction histidine kinase